METGKGGWFFFVDTREVSENVPHGPKILTQGGIDKNGVCVSIGFSFRKGESFRFMLLVRGCIFSHNLTDMGWKIKLSWISRWLLLELPN